MRWNVETRKSENILTHLLKLRGVESASDFLKPHSPYTLTAKEVGIDEAQLAKALVRIKKAIKNKETIVVYGDFDIDGVSATAIAWETLHELGAVVWPYIPDRKSEGYGFSSAGIKSVKEKYNPTLVITVDHGITASNFVMQLTDAGVDVIITDHHQAPNKSEVVKLCSHAIAVVHTTTLAGAGVSWFVSRQIDNLRDNPERLALAALGTIGDVLPLQGPNRQIVSHGLPLLSQSSRVGIRSLLQESGLLGTDLDPYHIGYILGPRINAAGRLGDALDALRLFCTKDERAAIAIAQKLASLNRKRQLLTNEQIDMSLEQLKGVKGMPPLLVIADSSYDEGIIGLIAGSLSRRFYRPTIVIAQNENGISKASARSIPGVDIIKLIRQVEDQLVNAGGHTMAAGFSVETGNISQVAEELIQKAVDQIDPELLERVLNIDLELNMEEITRDLLDKIEELKPFGTSNEKPIFSMNQIYLDDVRKIGKEGNHLKVKVNGIDAIGFSKAYMLEKIDVKEPVDIAFTLDLNKWNGNENLQLMIKDIKQG
ncbi:single-stranded-DNA-specific exonuclease RecJ [Candidatus Roizmanbacteria bacterium CG22_combo_CG10-13_8_21_14_all_38_20]|uniref:Single-stranded-DNA-specific exonuclease RecJ n=1 Tax=Candidatus Roizmanbacteria bacterium CG22_combo_CG10-13_8_21_14_all_38_20 TaxID=1974862 RepID=A0A2H0BVR1_9BACT|nr:single-stranded-DNA-specific exonuclease RecJ [Candidatus Microgenomates bacterium]PIP61058.1 MAG: single-stranded-DNA-specific exonuclease RecJ [Candidatus Roizmanbacteria bacterium CG22_combo_CG10-13_8_21_14_all_38_20]PJC30844.1 MAG: single-stranded-DNA-specific exonuclease RecJ [Candidatus Roizmanbacteria bacterium CG_4_9_14_0_2_um_filter_38_17]